MVWIKGCNCKLHPAALNYSKLHPAPLVTFADSGGSSMAFFKGEGILSGDFFESAVEVTQTLESAFEAGFAYVSVLKQEFFGFIDSIVVYKLSESKARHFLEIAAKGSLAQEGQLGGFPHLSLRW
jgi:hypothetical protein